MNERAKYSRQSGNGSHDGLLNDTMLLPKMKEILQPRYGVQFYDWKVNGGEWIGTLQKSIIESKCIESICKDSIRVGVSR